MNIADNIIKNKLKNVYFIWGSGKTVTANALAAKYGFFVYHTDNRTPHFKKAEPEYQPTMCRNVPDVWVLDKNDMLGWEAAIVREMTPMIICDLITLADRHDRVICEGDIDIDSIINCVTNAVTIINHGKSYDFFDRPDQHNMLDSIRNRTDISETEKQKMIENAYNIVKSDYTADEPPHEVTVYGVKSVIRDETTTPDDVAAMIAKCWGII